MRKESRLFQVLHACAFNAMLSQAFLPAMQSFAAQSPMADRPVGSFGPVTSNAFTPARAGTDVPLVSETNEAVSETASSEQLLNVLGGPGQVESSGFSLNTTDGMVDPFTGDFSYSIPLMDVEGYPITISYNSNVGMMDEASWVGLGWNLNVGSVAREMRGIPDEFDGSQQIKRIYSVLPDDIENGNKAGIVGGVSYKNSLGKGDKSFVKVGTDITVLFGGYENPYTGHSRTFDFNMGASLTVGKSMKHDGTDMTGSVGLRGGLGYSSDDKNGIGRSTSVGAVSSYGATDKGSTGTMGLNWGSNFHSRAGITQRGLSGNVAYNYESKYGENNALARNYGFSASPFGASFTCGTPTSVPRIEMSSTTNSSQFVFDATMSYSKSKTSMWALTLGMETQEYNSQQQLVYSDETNKIQRNPAFGYFHSAARSRYEGTDQPVMDFNRERDGQLSPETKNLPFSFPTYDVFYVNGMGISATFRGERNDAGTYQDGRSNGKSDGAGKNLSVGYDLIATPPTVSISTGFVYTDQTGLAESGGWENDAERFAFGSDDNVFFKGIGEPTPKRTGLFQHLQGELPAYLKLGTIEGSNPTITKGDVIAYNGGEHTLSPATLTAAQAPDTRAHIYRPLLASEMKALDSINRVYPLNIFHVAGTPYTRIDTAHPANNISGIEVVTSGGMNYSYALPVYSLNESAVVFSSGAANAVTSGPDAGLAAYAPGTDNSIGNGHGRAHLYDKTTVPAYATSFLLTGVTSSDYVDLENDGYTIDDIGDYYKINYSRVFDQGNPFKWRFPMNEDHAFFNEGLLATDLDNMATYTYGEKEIWYTHSVESKNLVAEFTLLPREDIASATDENGGVDTGKKLQYLSKITLYNRSERITQGGAAQPLQVVEFIYDYSLCPGVPTSINGGGKLTLLEIRVYSGPKSQETALHPYKFSYIDASGDDENNPPFSYTHSDRWGNYNTDTDSLTKPLVLYPYTEQDENQANRNVKAWKLKTIELPMGSEMEIRYEADSYRYVQNQRAMKHLDIQGYTNPFEFAGLMNASSWNGSSGVSEHLYKRFNLADLASMTGMSSGDVDDLNAFYTSLLLSGNADPLKDMALYTQPKLMPCNIVVFELEKPIIAATKEEADVLFRETYLKSNPKAKTGEGYINELYLRNFVQVKEGAAYELVPTFAKIRQTHQTLGIPGRDPIAPTGVMPLVSGEYSYGYIILENVLSTEVTAKTSPIVMSPVQKTALEFARLHLTDIVYGSCADPDCEGDVTIDRKAFWRNGDLYPAMMKAGYMEKISLTHPSQVRLYDYDNKKPGGNARVSMIIIRDKWDAISALESGTEYYWTYDYQRYGYGVAAYEPASGNDENPLYAWDRYTNKSVSFPDESRFTVMPIGESVFPSPVVGYNAVSVRLGGNKAATTTNLGYSLTTFETAEEHPTIARSTDIQKVKADKTTKFKKEIDLYGLSQGHSIVTNNFHGQPKAYYVYNGNGDLQARTSYTYKQQGAAIQMLDRNGVMSDEKVAMECDVYADSRFITSRFETTTIGLSLSFPLAPTPSFIPNGFSPVFSLSSRTVGYYTHTLNKHIHYSAIVESVETETMGSINSAKDVLYDKQTGITLLSSLTDEYNDELFSFSYPAYWYYPLFRNPLEQSTAPVTGTIAAGTFTATPLLTDLLTVGDLVELDNGTVSTALVLSVSGNTARLINTTTYATLSLTGAYTLTLVKSGRKNIQTAMMQSVVTKRNPINGSVFTFPVADVLSASAVSFRPRVNVLCSAYGGTQPISVVQETLINPFHYGLLNNLVLKNSLVPQLERSETTAQGVRFNGAYIGYLPYYTRNVTSGEWVHYGDAGYSLGDGSWRAMGEYSVLDEYGRPVESKDQIRVSSAVLYGYNRYNKLVPVAQAVNAKQHEIAYDSFDDYSYMQGTLLTGVVGHFDYYQAMKANSKDILLSDKRHSGLKALQVNAGVTAAATRNVTPSDACPSPVNDFSDNQYRVEPCMCVKGFEPIEEQKYILSLWVQGSATNAAGNYTDVSVTVTYSFASSPDSNYTYTPKGQVIDGWQRIEEVLTIPSNATEITVKLVNGAPLGNGPAVYFDDIRIHPELAGMTTTVYDPETLLPLATHDGYNFTTYYGYDENLAPVRVRVETINGIQTISESEGSTLPKFKN